MLRDKDLREPLFEFLEEKYGKVRIFEEKVTGSTRADVMMVGEHELYGIEIKSDADTYTRLERQVHDYDLTFDYNLVAVGTKHAHHVEEHVPEWWGIITMEETEGRVDCLMLREPALNPRDHYLWVIKRQLGFLWRPELNHILEQFGYPKYARKSKADLQKFLLEHVEHDKLRDCVCSELLERDYSELLKNIADYKAAHERPKKKSEKKKTKIKRKR